MISFLRGTVVEKLPDGIIVDVRGLGYEIQTTPRVYQRAQPGEEIALYTHFQVREDAQILYGFHDLSERALFRQLINVNGVGPKTGMAILAALKPEELIKAVLEEDATRLKVPGVGPKTVKRLILELKPQMKGMESVSLNQPSGSSLHTDVTNALEQLGYSANEIRQALEGTDISTFTLSEAVRITLKNLQS